MSLTNRQKCPNTVTALLGGYFLVFAQQNTHRATHGATGIDSPSTYHYTRNEYDYLDFDRSHHLTERILCFFSEKT